MWKKIGKTKITGRDRKKMNFEEIKTIVELMSANDLTEFKIEAEGYNLCLKRGCAKQQITQVVAGAPVASAPAAAPVAAPAAAPASAPAADSAPKAPAKTIDSPLVGTFYRAPSPDSPPFVKVGDRVSPDTVVCIVEAMKVMNEVKAETSGVIKDILCTDGTAVEYGLPLFVIE